jgi:hypothetical protein
MWEQTRRIAAQASARIAENIANFLPGVVVFCFIVLVAVLVAMLARFVTVRVLRRVAIDDRAREFGLDVVGEWPSTRPPSLVMGRIVFWLIVTVGLLVALTALDATIPNQFAVSVFQYLPNLLAATAIVSIGTVLARFLARSVLINAVNMQIQGARLLSLGVKWLVLVLTAAMALEQLRIGRQILLLAFGILFGGIVLTLALAVGLGSKEVVTRSLERQIREPTGGRDELDHI